jgi:uncharacterized protein DUF4388
MVEGDLMDLTLPTLLQALSQESSTAQLRLQNGAVQGALYLREGALIHATGSESVGDDALLELLGWTAGRFRILRDVEDRPRTITPRLTELVTSETKAARPSGSSLSQSTPGISPDQRLLQDALALLTQLDLDSVKVSATLEDASGIATLLVLERIINSLVGFVVARTSDLNALPSRVLHRLGSSHPHAEVITEIDERLSIETVSDVLRTWQGDPERQRQFFAGVCEALFDLLAIYGRTVGTFFRSTHERQEWRATFDVFVGGLTTTLALASRDQSVVA